MFHELQEQQLNTLDDRVDGIADDLKDKMSRVTEDQTDAKITLTKHELLIKQAKEDLLEAQHERQGINNKIDAIETMQSKTDQQIRAKQY